MESSRALSGASEVEVVFEVNWPTRERKDGSQALCAAATVMRPATKESPSREPAITRQTRMAAMMPPVEPVSRFMAVLWFVSWEVDGGTVVTYNCYAVGGGYQTPREEDVVCCICSDETEDNCRDGGVDS